MSADPSPLFGKILIANRGEIAVRVIRACREMGITAVAIFSEVDRDALHVRLADEAYPIGPAPASQSYLSIPKILEAAQASGAEAIHPGYGFLSENPLLPEACEKAGITFIGPGAGAMRMMGNKVTARAAMIAAGVPVTPGTGILPDDPAAARKAVGEIPFPILIKAAAGGGGKGMRIVKSAGEMESALAQARSEARSAFGDPSVYGERYVTRPRHIEVQILADTQGTVLHLGERECTIQRRHQKLIEESPSPVVDAATRARLGEMAVRAAKAAGYVGAGTCEFLRDDDGSFYFMEMNARLQVEHPVTEMVTGRDLVKLQIRIAAGLPLGFEQDQTAPRGWSMECRIFAEDPARNFMPSPGRIGTLRVPAGPGIRDDGGVYQGYRVPLEYDPMISKLVSWGQTREEAIARMRRALDEYRIEGVRTTIPFHRRVMRHPAFLRGDMDTSFIETHRGELFARATRVEAKPAGAEAGTAGSGTDEAAVSGTRTAGFDPLATLPPGMKAADVKQAPGKGKAASKAREVGAAGGDGRPAPADLTSRQIAVIAAAIAAFHKAKAESLDAAFEMSKGAADESDLRAARSRSPRLPGWKLAGRIATLRDR